jgi:menaquinone-dependent protoporphyrinogen IX oxidase
MKTGIIIHSNTSNTLSIGERLLETLRSKGADAGLERVTAVNEDAKTQREIRLASTPDIGPYGMVILGAPVHGFALSRAMTAYIKQLPGLQGKKVFCFVTEHFPKPWMGGNRAIRQMTQLVTELGGTVIRTAVVNWTSKAREEQISRLVTAFTADSIGG